MNLPPHVHRALVERLLVAARANLARIRAERAAQETQPANDTAPAVPVASRARTP